MKLLAGLFAMLTLVSCVRLSDDVLVSVDKDSISDLASGASVAFDVNERVFNELYQRLDAAFVVDVIDNESGKQFIYYHRRASGFEFTSSDEGLMSLKVTIVEVTRDLALDMGDGVAEKCVQLRFTDGVSVVRSRAICH